MSTYFSISASNVTFTESYNYGIVKAGDAGSGARGRDGVGGSDTSNNSSPGNGTSGGLAGTAGSPGIAYIYGTTNSMTNFNEAVFTSGSAGIPGSQGNNGFGGLNLFRYSYVGPNSFDSSHGFDSNGWIYGYGNNLLWTNPEIDKESTRQYYGIYFGNGSGIKAEILSGENILRITFGNNAGEYSYNGTKLQGKDITYISVQIKRVWLYPNIKKLDIYKNTISYVAYVTENIASAVYHP